MTRMMNSTAFFSLPHKAFATVTGLCDEFRLYLTIVLIGTYDLLPFCNLDGQMARRGSEFHFARYHMEDENDCQAFCNALSSLLKQIALQVDHDALIQRWWYFFEGSIGCIGILKQWAGAVIVPRVAGRKSRTHPCPSGAVCAARCQMGADACGCQKWGSRIPVC